MTNKIYGLDLGVGAKPTYLSARMACQFNQVFLSMFEAFTLKERVVCTSGFGFENLNCPMIGFVASSRIRKWLQFWQLITVTQEKQDGNKYYVIEATKIGWDSYEKGAILQIDVNGTNSIGIGVGKPYGVFDTLWKEIDQEADIYLTKATRANWEYEFEKQYLASWIGITLDNAKPEITKWLHDRIEASPKRKKFAKKTAAIDKTQRRLFEFPTAKQKTKRTTPKKKPKEIKRRRKARPERARGKR
jgi:hypothetical protein